MSLNYTPLRHKMLRAVARGYVVGTTGRPYFDFSAVYVSTPSQRSRAFHALWGDDLIDVYNDNRVEPSDKGAALLVDWTSQHGEPQ